MHLYQEPRISTDGVCPYLPDRQHSTEYFFADNVDYDELDFLLSTGWRKFGAYYFRPSCGECKACIPVRIKVKSFRMSKSQKRVECKNRDTIVEFGNVIVSQEIFQIMHEHSMARFGKSNGWDDYVRSFCTPSCPSMQSFYNIDGQIAASGFIDMSSHSLSSVYFIYRPMYSKRSLGILSVLKEVERAFKLGLDYYYLGYFVEGNDRMAYKASFYPQERYDWQRKRWEEVKDDN